MSDLEASSSSATEDVSLDEDANDKKVESPIGNAEEDTETETETDKEEENEVSIDNKNNNDKTDAVGRERTGSIIGGRTKVEVTTVLPVTVSFKHLFYNLKVRPGKNPFKRKVKKTLIKDANGELRPGEVTCIMGPSGAGKTTLLNILAGRLNKGKVKGEILVNGVKLKHLGSKWSRLSAYIMQDDILHANLTPRESFWFSAQLRLPFTLDQQARRNKVESLIEELGLEECAKQKIGSVERRGISGGQRKRAAIGSEMITDPSVLFLDEPTSGLDSSTSLSLVETLRKLAMCGRTIAATIHSPSTDMFFRFDNLILLTEGHIIYNGPTRNVVSFFSKLNFKCPKYTNPAEYIMDLAKKDSHISTIEEGTKRVEDLVTAYREMNGLKQLTSTQDQLASDPESNTQDTDSTEAKPWQLLKKHKEQIQKRKEISQELAEIDPIRGPPQIYRFFLLLIRSFLMTFRNPMMTYARLIQTVVLSLMVGLIYLDLGHNQASIQNREGALFFILTNQTMGGLMNVIMLFPTERMVFIREHATGAYGTLSYYLARVLSDLPFMLFFPCVFSAIVYWMCGLNNQADKFFIFYAALALSSLSAQSLGLMLSCGAPNANMAMVALPVLFIPLMLFGGFFLNTSDIPVYFIWIQYFSFFKYGFQILAINEFSGETFYCDPDETTSSGACPYTSGDEVIHSLGFDSTDNSMWASFLFLFMQIFLFSTLAYLALRFTAGRKRA